MAVEGRSGFEQAVTKVRVHHICLRKCLSNYNRLTALNSDKDFTLSSKSLARQDISPSHSSMKAIHK